MRGFSQWLFCCFEFVFSFFKSVIVYNNIYKLFWIRCVCMCLKFEYVCILYALWLVLFWLMSFFIFYYPPIHSWLYSYFLLFLWLFVSALIAINFAWNHSIFSIEMLTWCGVRYNTRSQWRWGPRIFHAYTTKSNCPYWHLLRMHIALTHANTRDQESHLSIGTVLFFFRSFHFNFPFKLHWKETGKKKRNDSSWMFLPETDWWAVNCLYKKLKWFLCAAFACLLVARKD